MFLSFSSDGSSLHSPWTDTVWARMERHVHGTTMTPRSTDCSSTCAPTQWLFVQKGITTYLKIFHSLTSHTVKHHQFNRENYTLTSRTIQEPRRCPRTIPVATKQSGQTPLLIIKPESPRESPTPVRHPKCWAMTDTRKDTKQHKNVCLHPKIMSKFNNTMRFFDQILHLHCRGILVLTYFFLIKYAHWWKCLTLQKFDESLKVNNLRLQLVDDFLFHLGWVHNLTNRSINGLPQLIGTAQRAEHHRVHQLI